MMVCLVVGMIGISVTEMCLIECGLYSGWIFLRYFQFNHETKMKGNDNEEFALGMLFPPIIRIPIVLLSNCCYAVCDSVGCCHSGSQYDTSNNGPNITNGAIDTSSLANKNTSDNIGNNMELLIDHTGTNDIQSADPEQQKKRYVALLFCIILYPSYIYLLFCYVLYKTGTKQRKKLKKDWQNCARICPIVQKQEK